MPNLIGSGFSFALGAQAPARNEIRGLDRVDCNEGKQKYASEGRMWSASAHLPSACSSAGCFGHPPNIDFKFSAPKLYPLSEFSVATTSERNQIMGHSRADIFERYYISVKVKRDVQSAYVGCPAKEAIIQAVGRFSLTHDPRAPPGAVEQSL
ncbi:hypothetical protein CIHG_06231 [Coccidioides immitis H538.4]|uniref:Uncharacterized protein n=2 Tax=Coccidioides immitis TaxID=5501 RepID=A0A0J8RV46_COCIT|nr:hypothetical protein CIRG_09509 [Coccidioides immitis RMSCC 2394]KMU88431.1 hypothetical protein CIHG_06231 [Coccidioides immitis H538.4]